MKTSIKNMKTGLVLLAILIVSVLLISGCGMGSAGESYFDPPDGPKMIFRGGYGNIVIKYQPPPEPIFKIGFASAYLDYDMLYQKYGVVEQPLVITYVVKTSVSGADVRVNTLNPAFDAEVLSIIKSWTYTKWGFGRLKIKIEMAKSRITIDYTDALLAEGVPNQSLPRFGEPKDMVAAYGFGKIVRDVVE